MENWEKTLPLNIRGFGERIVTFYALDYPIEAIQGLFIAKDGIDIPYEEVTGFIESYADFCRKAGIGYGLDNSWAFFKHAHQWLQEEFSRQPMERQTILNAENQLTIARLIQKFGLPEMREPIAQFPKTIKQFFRQVEMKENPPFIRKEREWIPICIRCHSTSVVRFGKRKLSLRGTIQIYRCTSCSKHFHINRALFETHQLCPYCNTRRLVFPTGDPVVTESFSTQVYRCLRCERNFSKTDYSKYKYPTEIRELAVENVKSGLSTYQSKEILDERYEESPSQQTVWKYVVRSKHFAPQFRRPMEKACVHCDSTMYHKHSCPVWTHLRLALAVRKEN